MDAELLWLSRQDQHSSHPSHLHRDPTYRHIVGEQQLQPLGRSDQIELKTRKARVSGGEAALDATRRRSGATGGKGEQPGARDGGGERAGGSGARATAPKIKRASARRCVPGYSGRAGWVSAHMEDARPNLSYIILSGCLDQVPEGYALTQDYDSPAVLNHEPNQNRIVDLANHRSILLLATLSLDSD